MTPLLPKRFLMRERRRKKWFKSSYEKALASLQGTQEQLRFAVRKTLDLQNQIDKLRARIAEIENHS